LYNPADGAAKWEIRRLLDVDMSVAKRQLPVATRRGKDLQVCLIPIRFLFEDWLSVNSPFVRTHENFDCWVLPVCAYASGVGRRPTGLFGRPALEPSRIFFVDPNELDEVFDTEVGERLDAIFSDAIDPDETVLDLHFTSDVPQPVFVLAKLRGHTVDGGNVVNFVDVHDHATRAESAAVGGVQFQGSSSSSR
jgi:hypothetical protein